MEDSGNAMPVGGKSSNTCNAFEDDDDDDEDDFTEHEEEDDDTPGMCLECEILKEEIDCMVN